MTEERDNLREDLKGHKDSKRSVDNSWKAERIRVEKLEKELEFYLTQMQRAMSDRDQAGPVLGGIPQIIRMISLHAVN